MYYGEVVWLFCISLCTVYLSFCGSGTIVPCSTGLAMFTSVKQAHTDPRTMFFHKDETATHLSHDMQ